MALEGQADKYEVLEKIGQGSFGVIRKVKRKQDGMVSYMILVKMIVSRVRNLGEFWGI